VKRWRQDGTDDTRKEGRSDGTVTEERDKECIDESTNYNSAEVENGEIR
jgi:hypothetical protein